MPEFDLIRRLQQTIEVLPAAGVPDCVVGIGDDAAVLELPPGKQLVLCTDTLVEGVHFPVGTPARAVGHKALAVNLSDLAAMGADPAWFFLAMTLPREDTAWLDEFAAGMAALARGAGIVLAGGDTTSGGLSLTITATGLVDSGTALTRSGARAGDRVFVSGCPGRAARALHRIRDGGPLTAEQRRPLDYPAPRLDLGRALRGLASACIDVSDGLAADLGHILDRSGVGARIDTGRLPVDACFAGLPDAQRWSLQLAGGDDYELCFTLPPARVEALEAITVEGGVAVTEIGEIRAGQGLEVTAPGGAAFVPGAAGYQHFGGDRPPAGQHGGTNADG